MEPQGKHIAGHLRFNVSVSEQKMNLNFSWKIISRLVKSLKQTPAYTIVFLFLKKNPIFHRS